MESQEIKRDDAASEQSRAGEIAEGIEVYWRPVRESNPCRRRERAVS